MQTLYSLVKSNSQLYVSKIEHFIFTAARDRKVERSIYVNDRPKCRVLLNET